MNDIERVTQAIGRGEIQPPSLAPMQPNRNQGPPPMPVSHDFFELAAPLRGKKNSSIFLAASHGSH